MNIQVLWVKLVSKMQICNKMKAENENFNCNKRLKNAT